MIKFANLAKLLTSSFPNVNGQLHFTVNINLNATSVTKLLRVNYLVSNKVQDFAGTFTEN